MTREERHIAVLNRMLENMDVYDSIQPTTERKKAIKAAIQALEQNESAEEWYKLFVEKLDEQEPCDDAISRDWLKTAIHNFYYGLNHTPSEEDIQAYIDAAPSVTHKSGKWQVVSDGYGDSAYICECSECKDTVWVYKNADRKWKYCPNCGAKMVEPQEIHCNYTDEEIAKSFIEDVEAVKDLLPLAESRE